MVDIEYFGGHHTRNLGDVAIYRAVRELLDEHRVFEDGGLVEPDCGIIGGGTLFPRILHPSVFPFKKRDVNISIGTGVMGPEYYNRQKSFLDVRYYAGERGFSLRTFKNKRSYVGSGLMHSIERRVPGLDLTSVYLTEADFNSAQDIDFDILGVRGPLSQEILESYGIESEIIGDPALLLEPDVSTTVSGRVVISLRDPDADGWGEPQDVKKSILTFCKNCSETFEFRFVPLNPSDIRVNVEVASKLSNAEVVDHCTIPNVAGVINEMAQAEVTVGERLHSNILSAASGTPFLSIEYKPKHTDFARSINCSSWNIRRDKLNECHLGDKVTEILADERKISDMTEQVKIKKRLLEDVSYRINNIVD